jgi:hypothetical protein
MKQQFDGLEGVWGIPIKPNMKVLPGKWVSGAPETYLECSQFNFKTLILNAWIPPGTDYFVEQPHVLEKGLEWVSTCYG